MKRRSIGRKDIITPFEFAAVSLAQKTIAGTITSEDGKLLAGATITKKEKKNVTASLPDGTFSIKLASEKSTLSLVIPHTCQKRRQPEPAVT